MSLHFGPHNIGAHGKQSTTLHSPEPGGRSIVQDELDDHPRSGRPATYSPDAVAAVIAAVIAAALTSPRRLGLPFASWTLDRLAAYLLEHKGIAMRRSRIDEILLAEGLRWRRHGSKHCFERFGARVDPEFAAKRGASRRSTPRHRRAA